MAPNSISFLLSNAVVYIKSIIIQPLPLNTKREFLLLTYAILKSDWINIRDHLRISGI